MLRIGQRVDNVHGRHAFNELLFQPEQTLRLGFARQAFQHRLAILNSQILVGREVVIGSFGGRFQLRTSAIGAWANKTRKLRLDRSLLSPDLLIA
jgi:hypothetical protein